MKGKNKSKAFSGFKRFLKKCVKVFLIVILTILLLFVISIEIFPMYYTKNFEGSLFVEENFTTKEVSLMLKEKGFIIDTYGFLLIAKLTKKDGVFKSGIHEFKGVDNVFKLIAELEKKGLPIEISITFPEGFSVKDIAERLKSNKIILDSDSFVEYAKSHEGFLFPDTYKFIEGESFENIVSKMEKRFWEIVGNNFEKLSNEKGFTQEEVVILASIVEKEGKLDKDRPLIASVFLNRLKIGMPLQADSTINYLLPEHKEWLSPEDYQIDSPYNTYKYTGLPPSPICNPGKASIFAVLEAPESSFYYFMTKPDGEALFSETLEEHERNLSKYYGRY